MSVPTAAAVAAATSHTANTIQLRQFTVAQLRDVMRALSKPVSNLSKSDLRSIIQQSLVDDKERTTRAIVDISRNYRLFGLTPTAVPAPPPAPAHVVAAAAAAASASTAPHLVKRILDVNALQVLELESHQGLVEQCRVIGACVVDQKYPQTNRFGASGLLSDEILGFRTKQYRLIVRFLLYDPSLASSKPLKFSPIWPKECKLVMSNEVIFDTFPKNRLGMQAVGFKEPAPAVDVSDRYLALTTASTSSSSSAPLTFEFSVSLNASHMKWLVVATVVKKKLQKDIVSEILQKSPTVNQCTQRVQRYFSSADENLGITDAEISLKDPASLAPIKIAARGQECIHLQCFDLFTFLDMHESSRQPTWKCPLCAKEAYVKTLVTDSWFQSMLDTKTVQSSGLGGPKDAIRVYSKAKVRADGTWTLVEDEPEDDDEEEDYSDVPAKRQRTTEVITASRPVVSLPAPPRPKFGRSKADAIELLDDDDILF